MNGIYVRSILECHSIVESSKKEDEFKERNVKFISTIPMYYVSSLDTHSGNLMSFIRTVKTIKLHKI